MTTEVGGPPSADDGRATGPAERHQRRWVERAIAGIHGDAERMRRREAERAITRLDACGDLTEEQRAAVEAMTEAVVGRLLAVPARRLRRARDPASIPAALDLFDVELPTGGQSRTGGHRSGGDR